MKDEISNKRFKILTKHAQIDIFNIEQRKYMKI